ncbi:hypothetical protein Tco_0199759 [Tanacetum coccineum]
MFVNQFDYTDVRYLETFNSLTNGEVHFDTSKDSFESSVRDSFSIPRESNNLSNGVIEDFQNEFKNEKNSNSETIADIIRRKFDISCDMIPPGNDTDDDWEGDAIPPLRNHFDRWFLFPLPKVDILPIEVEPVEVMFNDSHTYGENLSQVEREFLSMVDEFLNFSNDDETFDPGGGENDVLLNNGENNDLNVLTTRTFLPFVTIRWFYPFHTHGE